MAALLIPLMIVGIAGMAIGAFLWTINGGLAATKGGFIAAGGLAVLIVSIAGLVL